jgi:hypothetical protein
MRPPQRGLGATRPRRGALRAEGREAGGASPGCRERSDRKRGYPRLGHSPCPGAVRCAVGSRRSRLMFGCRGRRKGGREQQAPLRCPSSTSCGVERSGSRSALLTGDTSSILHRKTDVRKGLVCCVTQRPVRPVPRMRASRVCAAGIPVRINTSRQISSSLLMLWSIANASASSVNA